MTITTLETPKSLESLAIGLREFVILKEAVPEESASLTKVNHSMYAVFDKSQERFGLPYEFLTPWVGIIEQLGEGVYKLILGEEVDNEELVEYLRA